LALTHDKTGKYREAISAYEEAYKLTGSASLLFRVALIYDQEFRQYPQAKNYYQQYLKQAGSYNTTEKLYAEDRLAEMKRAEFMDVDD
jgi:tetratricopeptide (TPR) repeat protein